MRWNELTPPEWRELDRRTWAELNSTGTLQPFEKEYFRKDGSRVPVLIGGALFEEGGNESPCEPTPPWWVSSAIHQSIAPHPTTELVTRACVFSRRGLR